MLLAADAQRFDVFSINRVESLIQRCYTSLNLRSMVKPRATFIKVQVLVHGRAGA